MTSQAPFRTVERHTVSDAVRDQLLERIHSGTLAPGDRLPSERALCEQLSVGRTSVREALQALVSMRYIERRGNGTFVLERVPAVDVSVDDRKVSVRQLFETRRAIEVPIAEFAAQRATDAQREEIHDIGVAFVDALDEFRALDRRFHTAVAAASGNPLLTELYERVLDALFTAPSFSSLLYAEANRDEVAVIVERSGAAHREIAAALSAADVSSTRQAAEAHLCDVEQRMVERLV